ncbi:exosome complex exonuclease RRP40, putative [Trypanosoma brucei gambiense DAL972]|uniref:Exosome complex exonuclease RRP40, putative n=1 Tax=Trypanosoma brucei gambiense (strain MHOM/CI/86/DAL972) TaxID=679716 RepID=C9ZY06_TRYB9|nr:exosome complex exonuclease RRP40, putative [Trypanosoma brucei gambiense DAL972]CBH14301.1 exosome complex exonuclease RRP40, putative [Trypanosoma brucei gambiense DAL972]|eukprot:XP_011776571.1 exosome complex exonuclease RRP40, putative [Trypanosoma brucei gambiense DAL972]
MSETNPVVRGAVGVHELAPLCSHVCLPGESVLLLEPTAVVTLGSGLHPLQQDGSDDRKESFETSGEEGSTVVVSEFCGPVLRTAGPNHTQLYKLNGPAARRYMYAARDPVVAIVMKKNASYYSCYTGAASLAVLDALGFDGATKTNKPRLQEGDVVYAFVKGNADASSLDTKFDDGRVVVSSSDEVELSCMAAEVGLVARDWTSAEAVFGPLVGGTVVRVALPYARSLIDGPASRLLALLGDRVPYDVCVGVNGLVWVRGHPSAADPTAAARRTVAVAACVVEAQDAATLEEMEAHVRGYFPKE